MVHCGKSFQSAPLTEARGDASTHPPSRSEPTRTFQSAPLTEARGPKSKRSTLKQRSFTARHRSRGDIQLPDRCNSPCEFQSAPLTEARGDSLAPALAAPADTYGFQSAPLTEARGDPLDGVSEDAMSPKFQSAPLTEARGDKVPCCKGGTNHEFCSPHR